VRQGLLPRRLPLFLVRLALRFPKAVLVAALISWVLAGVIASRVKVETDILSLVPEQNPVVKGFKETVERFGSVDTLLVVVRLNPDQDTESMIAYADCLAGSLREWELIDWVEYRLQDPTQALMPLLDRTSLMLGPDEVEELLTRLDEEGLREQAETILSRLRTPQSMVMKDLIRLDPMGMVPKILERVSFGDVGASFDPETGCLTDPERRYLLMLAKPVRPAQDIAFNKVLADGLPARVELANHAWAEEGWEETPPAVEFTGGYIIALVDSELIISDLVLGAIGSLVGVMALFLLAFRRRATLMYALLPLVTGLGLTFSFAGIVLGRLNSATSAFAALLIGLGIDFIIVLYGRYVEERQAGADHRQAVEALGRHTGVGVLLGAVTTSATFFAFLSTDFRGLSELGLITGTGILLLMVTVFLLLPALLTLLQHRRRGGKRLYLHSFGSDMICRASVRRPGLAVTLTALGAIALGIAAGRLEFDDDIRNMRAGNNRGILLQQEVMNAFDLRFTPMMVRLDGANEAEALAAAQEILPYLEALVDGENLGRVDTIAGVLPSQADQEQVIEILGRQPIDPQALQSGFAEALGKTGLNPAAFAEGVEYLGKALRVDQPLRLSDFEGTVLERMVERYVVPFDGGVSTVIYCFPPANRWRRDAPPPLLEVMSRFPDAVLAGPNVVSAELRQIVWGDAAVAAALGLVLVFLLLWADLGSPMRSLLALLPLIVGMAWMLGTMALLGMKINYMNVFVCTMIIGIGVDYGVHLLHRWHESGGNPKAVAETAKAIAVAALTTMVGFGSLVLSHYPGLRSVGAAAILGGLFTALMSITMLPAVLTMRRGQKNLGLPELNSTSGKDSHRS
jgi:predicted exporter